MVEKNCALCSAGCKVEDVSGVLTHVVENMTEDGKPQIVVCFDSPIKPACWMVALRAK
jgi:hypothetical protein